MADPSRKWWKLLSTAGPKRKHYFPLSTAQTAFLTAQATIKGFVGGQGAGKSYIGSYDLLRRLRPGRLYMVLAPTYPMMRDATFRTFRSLAERLGKLRDWRKVEFIVEVATDYGGSAR